MKRAGFAGLLLSIFAVFCLVGLLGNQLTFALTWEGRDLSRYGLYKGAGLPLSPGVFNSYGFPLGGKQLAEGIPANTLMPILLVNIYTADELLDGAGHKVPGDHNISVFTYFPRLVYFYPFQPKDGRFRFYTDFILPVTDQYVHGIHGGGVADITYAPLALAYAGLGTEAVPWSGFLEPAIIFPSGRYDPDRPFNLGANAYTFDLIWENYLNFPKLGPFGGPQIHTFLCYTNANANDNFVILSSRSMNQEISGKSRSSYETGDVLTLNVEATYPLSPNVHFGGKVGFIQQLHDDELDGKPIHGSREKAVSVGPVLSFAKGRFTAYLSSSIEIKAENRFKGVGNWVILTYVF
jgi:hypothetical protein